MIARRFMRSAALLLPFLFVIQLFGQSNICRSEMDAHFTLINHDDGSSSGAFRFAGSLTDTERTGALVIAGYVNGRYTVLINRILTWNCNGCSSFDETLTGLEYGIYDIVFADGIYNCRIAVTIQLEGCTDPDATNYNPNATLSNGLCEYEGNVCPSIFQINTTPPDCGEQNGSITIRSSGADLRYSIDGGATYSNSGTFDNLGQGNYTLVANNPREGCTDSETIQLYCGGYVPPEGHCPEIAGTNIVQLPSTCTSSDGEISVSASPSSSYRYRLVGVTDWTHRAFITGVPSGTHTIEVIDNISGCGTTGTITVGCIPSCSDGRRNGTETGVDCGGSCAPCCPEGLGVEVVNYPYCPSDTDGSIRVSARGVNLQYSINNGLSWSTSPLFNNLRGNTSYAVKVRSTSRGCEELSLNYFLPCEERCPRITGIQTMTVANCDITDSGVIQINLAEGQGNTGGEKGLSDNGNPTYEYSIDGGNTWSAINIHTVSPGTYDVLVRNNETGCSSGQVVTVPCTSCFDGIQNGDETGVDCGGSYCHVCEGCPSIEEIKTSEAQSNSGSEGGDTGGKSEGRKNFDGAFGDAKGFICDQDDYRDCPNCISYRSCHDELDNDGDDLCDCADPDCSTWFDEVCEKPKESCEDGNDNDGDGLVDCMDTDCQGLAICGNDNSAIADFAREQYIDLLSGTLSHRSQDIIKYIGVPKWSETIDMDDRAVVPLVSELNRSVEGFALIGTKTNGKPYMQVIDRDAILNTRTSDLDSKGYLTDLFTRETAAVFVNMLSQKLYSRNDDGLSTYLDNFSMANLCIQTCIYTIIEDNDTGNGGDLFGDELKGWNYNENPGTGAHWSRRRNYIVYISCESNCDNGDGTTTVVVDTDGGSTSGGRGNTASNAFNDRIKNCNNGGGPGDPPVDGGEATTDEAFCLAVTRLINECLVGGPGSGLSSPGERHILEILDAIPDCSPGDPTQDDSGMLSEVASYVCSQGGGNETDQNVQDYVSYATQTGFDKVICFDDYLVLLDYIQFFNLQLSPTKFLELFDISRCFSQSNTRACITNVINTYFDTNFTNINLSTAQRNWLRNHVKDLVSTIEFLEDNDRSDESLATGEILIALSELGLEDATYDELKQNEALINLILSGSFNGHGLSDRLQVSGLLWATIFNTQGEHGDGNAAADYFKKQLENIRMAIEEGFEQVMKPIAALIDQVFDSLPQTQEEWAVLGNILGPILLDLGLDFIPIVGDIKGFTDALETALDGDYLIGSVEFIAAIASILPIGDLIKSIPKVRDAMSLISGAFNTLKSLARISGDIFRQVGDLLGRGWRVGWNNTLGQLEIFDDAGKIFARIADDIITFRYPGFGGDIVTDPNKTTTLIGRRVDQPGGIQSIIESGMTKSGDNKGGLNVLRVEDPTLPDDEIWEINRRWLNDAASRGDIIRVVSDPLDPKNLYKNGVSAKGGLTFFGMEIEYLTEVLGYHYDPVKKVFTK